MVQAMLQTASSAQHYLREDDCFSTASSERQIRTAIWNGRQIWVKCQPRQKASLRYRLHSAASWLLPLAHLRAVPLCSPEEMNRRQISKIRDFRSACIPVPDIICARGPVLVLSNVGGSIQKSLNKLRKTNAHLHDSLLIQCAETLGVDHAAGLCHGSPDLHDMFLSNGRVGFFDFKAYPETVMPLPAAQARDIWLLFFQIMAQALETHRTAGAAFVAWRRHISLETLENLRRLVHFFRIFTGPLKLARPIHLGDHSKRMLCATEFFISHLGL